MSGYTPIQYCGIFEKFINTITWKRTFTIPIPTTTVIFLRLIPFVFIGDLYRLYYDLVSKYTVGGC